jgi:hypothetical protein
MHQPISKEAHLKRGFCCQMGCIYCPWRKPIDHKPINVDAQIEAALRSGQTVSIESNRESLVPSVTLLGRVTINYRLYTNDKKE